MERAAEPSVTACVLRARCRRRGARAAASLRSGRENVISIRVGCEDELFVWVRGLFLESYNNAESIPSSHARAERAAAAEARARLEAASAAAAAAKEHAAKTRRMSDAAAAAADIAAAAAAADRSLRAAAAAAAAGAARPLGRHAPAPRAAARHTHHAGVPGLWPASASAAFIMPTPAGVSALCGAPAAWAGATSIEAVQLFLDAFTSPSAAPLAGSAAALLGRSARRRRGW